MRKQSTATQPPLPDYGPCWLATGHTHSIGYVVRRINGRRIDAHRYALQEAMGRPLTSQERACHICDEPSCHRADGPEGTYEVNSVAYRRFGHLWLGTVAANNADCAAKQRLPAGDRNGSRRHPERLPHGEDHWTQRHPERRPRGDQHWSRRHPEFVRRGSAHPYAKLTEADVRQIRALHAAGGITGLELAQQFGISRSLVSTILHRKIWCHVLP